MGRAKQTGVASASLRHATEATKSLRMFAALGALLAVALLASMSSHAATTERVSVSSAGEQANRECRAPSISADGWLVAYAKVKGCVVVTHELPSPDVRRKVPIPNVCRAFNVQFVDTFEMLRTLGVRFG